MAPLILVTKAELAAELRVAKRTIENWMLWGTLPKATYLGRRAYWPRPIIEAWKHAQFSAVLKTPVPIAQQPEKFAVAPPKPRRLARQIDNSTAATR
ncbi:hypothetical protein [Thiomonas sp.]|uniref:helix-turn-helix transcriptional regulator n=1 Tax=Thiomonas sp. TaxID=2047785 RepID=UPI002583387E|nr:hypothetical protein [Thiomonas sp.]